MSGPDNKKRSVSKRPKQRTKSASEDRRLLQALLRVLLELRQRGPRGAVRVHEPGVPRAGLTEPAVDVEPRELGLVAAALGVVLVGELEHVLRRRRGARGRRREVRRERRDAAGLGQPDLARDGLEHVRETLGLTPVDVLV